jgi:hypothetical protein
MQQQQRFCKLLLNLMFNLITPREANREWKIYKMYNKHRIGYFSKLSYALNFTKTPQTLLIEDTLLSESFII